MMLLGPLGVERLQPNFFLDAYPALEAASWVFLAGMNDAFRTGCPVCLGPYG